MIPFFSLSCYYRKVTEAVWTFTLFSLLLTDRHNGLNQSQIMDVSAPARLFPGNNPLLDTNWCILYFQTQQLCLVFLEQTNQSLQLLSLYTLLTPFTASIYSRKALIFFSNSCQEDIRSVHFITGCHSLIGAMKTAVYVQGTPWMASSQN